MHKTFCFYQALTTFLHLIFLMCPYHFQCVLGNSELILHETRFLSSLVNQKLRQSSRWQQLLELVSGLPLQTGQHPPLHPIVLSAALHAVLVVSSQPEWVMTSCVTRDSDLVEFSDSFNGAIANNIPFRIIKWEKKVHFLKNIKL